MVIEELMVSRGLCASGRSTASQILSWHHRSADISDRTLRLLGSIMFGGKQINTMTTVTPVKVTISPSTGIFYVRNCKLVEGDAGVLSQVLRSPQITLHSPQRQSPGHEI
jgi:hypothetical protein